MVATYAGYVTSCWMSRLVSKALLRFVLFAAEMLDVEVRRAVCRWGVAVVGGDSITQQSGACCSGRTYFRPSTSDFHFRLQHQQSAEKGAKKA